MDLINQTLNSMREKGLLRRGFNINNKLVNIYQTMYTEYQTTYTELLCLENNLNSTTSNIRQNRRLAYMNLLKYKRLNVVASVTKEGYIYVIKNPAWPNYVKIGRTGESKVRLGQMQTFSPFGDYEIIHYIPCLDMRQGERQIHKSLSAVRAQGEWFNTTDKVALNCIQEILSANSIGLE
jgi:site-specific DNA-adenine methylase